MKRSTAAFLVLLTGITVQAHDVITTTITWNREISRIFYERCASCHHEGGRAFSMLTYAEARPWAVAIKEEVLSRRMPPWGAVKGFGEFRNDQALTAEQLEMITSWVEGGVPEGDVKDLPPVPNSFQPSKDQPLKGALTVRGDFALNRPFTLDGLLPDKIPSNASIQVVAQLPDGTVEPLVWFYEYKSEYKHPFLFRVPLMLPRGTVIHGIPAGSSITLLPSASR